jgi:hypothetical protein
VLDRPSLYPEAPAALLACRIAAGRWRELGLSLSQAEELLTQSWNDLACRFGLRLEDWLLRLQLSMMAEGEGTFEETQLRHPCFWPEVRAHLEGLDRAWQEGAGAFLAASRLRCRTLGTPPAEPPVRIVRVDVDDHRDEVEFEPPLGPTPCYWYLSYRFGLGWSVEPRGRSSFEVRLPDGRLRALRFSGGGASAQSGLLS